MRSLFEALFQLFTRTQFTSEAEQEATATAFHEAEKEAGITDGPFGQVVPIPIDVGERQVISSPTVAQPTPGLERAAGTSNQRDQEGFTGNPPPGEYVQPHPDGNVTIVTVHDGGGSTTRTITSADWEAEKAAREAAGPTGADGTTDAAPGDAGGSGTTSSGAVDPADYQAFLDWKASQAPG